ncbi:MAG: glycosyltransferase [Candidatus Acidiferrum sp.]
MSAPLISVVVIAYNYGRFIEECLDSVLAQDFPMEKVEILVVDDGSTDDTGERVKKYGSRVRYLYKPNGGQASALNLGIANASGEIVVLLDADDFILPGKLARIAEAFERDPALGMAYHRIQEWHMDTGERRDWELPTVSGDMHKEPGKFVWYVTPPNLAISFRRSALNKLMPIPEEIRMLADCYIAALIPFIAPVLAIPEIYAIYRYHGTNSYASTAQEVPLETRKKKLRMWQIVTDAMLTWIAEHGYTRKQRAVKAMIDRWNIIVEREEFTVTPPSRVRFFRYLLQCYRYRYPLMGWKLRAINLSNALGALFVGYRNFHRLDEGREGLTRRMRTFVGGEVRSLPLDAGIEAGHAEAAIGELARDYHLPDGLRR